MAVILLDVRRLAVLASSCPCRHWDDARSFRQQKQKEFVQI